MAPRNTPRDIVNRLNAEISKITSRPEVRDAWAKQGALAMTMTPDEFAPLHDRRHREVGADREDFGSKGGSVNDPRAPMELHVLSAGAAQGLVAALAPRFLAETGVALRTTFGAVGAIGEKLMAGERCDALILTEAMIEELATSGRVGAATRAALVACAPASAFVPVTRYRISRAG